VRLRQHGVELGARQLGRGDGRHALCARPRELAFRRGDLYCANALRHRGDKLLRNEALREVARRNGFPLALRRGSGFLLAARSLQRSLEFRFLRAV
jgi:hypothetical protein